MAFTLTRAFGRLGLTSLPSAASNYSFRSAVRGQAVTGGPRSNIHVSSVRMFPVVSKQNCEKRLRQSEERRQRNKGRKSAIRTRMGKVFKAMDAMKFEPPKNTEEMAPVEQLISEAYKEIDKAVSKGVIHKNTGARRKSRIGKAKTKFMIDSGLYTPEPAEA